VIADAQSQGHGTAAVAAACQAVTGRFADPPAGGWQPDCVNYTLEAPPTPGERWVYVCESMKATVTTGQSVRAGQTIATFIPGGGIETGWAAAPANPVSIRAAMLNQQVLGTGDAGDNRTYCEQAMSNLIQRAGGSGGLAEGKPIVGTGC
jgi:hypothetical protein